MRAGLHEVLRRESAFLLTQEPPRAAVNEYMKRRALLAAGIEIERLGVRSAVGMDNRIAEARAHAITVDCVAADDLGGVRPPGALVVLSIQLRLIVVKKNRHIPPSGRAGMKCKTRSSLK